MKNHAWILKFLHLLLSVFKDFFSFFLFESQSEREKERERSSVCWIASQVTSVASAGRGPSQVPGAHPMWLAGIQTLGPPCRLFAGHQQEWGPRRAGTDVDRCVWGANIAGGGC